jgi:type IV secretion system protein VirD4
MQALDLLQKKSNDVFGKARFLYITEAYQLQLVDRFKNGRERLLIGWLTDREGNTPIPIYSHDAEGHQVTYAPTRAGKGTSQIVINLLSFTGSILVLDVKGENYKLTAGYRAKKLKQQVRRFSPFEKHTDHWNPFNVFRIDRNNPFGNADEQDDIDYFCDLIVEANPEAKEPFFENSARIFVIGLVTWVATVPTLNADKANASPEMRALVRERSMFEVCRLLNLSGKAFTALLRYMAQSERPSVQQAAESMIDMYSGDGRTGKSVLAVAREKLKVWNDYRIRRATYCQSSDAGNLEPAPNTIDFKSLRAQDGTTIYLCIPPDAMEKYKPVNRAMIGMAMRELRMNASAQEKKRSVVLMLDEFPQLGYMQPIEASLLYLAGYGVRFWFFIQDLAQLRRYYPNSWQTFMANSATQTYFGVNDLDTARLISERIGTTTVENVVHSLSSQQSHGRQESITFSDSTSDGPGGISTSNGTSRTTVKNWGYAQTGGLQFNQVGRELLKAEEVLTLPYEQQVIFMRPLPPVLAHKIDYFLIEELRKSAEIEPPHPISFD